jgi:hypothetical protein
MKTLRTLLLTAAAATLIAGAAQAANPTVSVQVGDVTPAGQTMVMDFDNPIAAGFSFVQNSAGAFVRSGSLGLAANVSAPPPGDLTNYETITGGASATLFSNKLLKAVSFYIGSPDSFNSISFEGPGYAKTLSGAGLFDPVVDFGGNQSIGRTITYTFAGAGVNKITFASDSNSFEFDNIRAATAGGVPEPTSWAMMIMGMAGLGGALRRRRPQAALAMA